MYIHKMKERKRKRENQIHMNGIVRSHRRKQNHTKRQTSRWSLEIIRFRSKGNFLLGIRFKSSIAYPKLIKKSDIYSFILQISMDKLFSLCDKRHSRQYIEPFLLKVKKLWEIKEKGMLRIWLKKKIPYKIHTI